MPFSFLNPWFWLGAAMLAAPILLHLRRKQQTNVQRFSTLRFLDDQPQPQRGPLRLRDIVLFSLRVLALLLLVGAFTWPYLRGADTAPIKESRVYILDNTLSHQAGNGFARDRDRILSDLSRAGMDTQIAVIELAATPRVVVAFGDARATAQQKVKSLQPSFQRGSYLAAFRQANSLLSNSLGDRKRIVFLGDSQENQWTESTSTPPFLRNVEVDVPKPSARVLPNVSLSEPRVQRIFLGDKSLVNFTAKLRHEGEARTANVVLRANGQVIFNRTVELVEQPETILLRAQWEAEPGAWIRGELAAEAKPDALSADDRVCFALAPVVEGTVALLAQSPYLRLALSPEVMRGEWKTRQIEPSRLGTELAANQDADVLCLESNYLQSQDARKLLNRYLSNGRGVFLIVNRVTPTIKGCLRELGFEAEASVDMGQGNAAKFQFIFSNHPIFHPFLSPDYGNLMEVKVDQYYRLRSSEAMPLIFSERGAVLFFQGARTTGKLFVMAFGLDRDHTSWPVHQTFIPFLDLALQAARAEDPTPTNFEPGEIAIVHFPPGSSSHEAVLLSDDKEVARAAIEHGKAELRLPDKPGLYTLATDDRSQQQKVFSVNPSPKESQLTYTDAPEAVKLWRVNRPVELARTSPIASRAKLSMAGILQQRFWWWMVVGSLLLLMLETALAEIRRERK